MLDPNLAEVLSQIFLDLHIDEAAQQYWALPQNRDWLVQRVRNIKTNPPSSTPIQRRQGRDSSTAGIGMGMR